MAQAKFCARVMDDWFPPRYFDTEEAAHKDRFRYGTEASTLYELQDGEYVKRPWRVDLPSDPVPATAPRK